MDNSTRRPIRRAGLVAFGLCCIALASAANASATDYPASSIRVIIPFAAGGPTDIVARIVTGHMARTLGQQIIIENVVGAGGTTAAIRTMRAPADGYTLMMGHMGTHGAVVAVYPHLAYDPSRDFTPIGQVAGMPILVLAKSDTPAGNLQEFLSHLRAHADTLTMAHAGVGSISYATCAMLNAIAGVHPPMTAYQGTGPAIQALVAGRVDYMCDQGASAVPRIQAGTVKAIAIAAARRNPILPNVPTAVEVGVNFEVQAWNALFAPRGIPVEIVDRLNGALGKALDDLGTQQELLEVGAEIPGSAERTPAALARLVEREIARWKPLAPAVVSNAP